MLIHQAKVQYMKDSKKRGTAADDKILKRIELSRQLLQRLKAINPMPSYADSLLESALHNKTRVLEAHLSTVTSDESQRRRLIRELDEHSRNAFFYVAA